MRLPAVLFALLALLAFSNGVHVADRIQVGQDLYSKNRALIEARIQELKKAGLLGGYPDYGHHPRDGRSRYEAAVAADFGFRHMSHLLKGYLRDREELGETFQEQMQHVANGFESMELLVRATARELSYLGVNLASVYNEIERMADAFKEEGFEVRRFTGFRFLDVPKDHWADQAVHSLRNAGILVGYPNGRFDGK